MTSPLQAEMSWRPGTELLGLQPSILAMKGNRESRVAKDSDYASAILKAWRIDLDSRPKGEESLASPLVYGCEGEKYPLYGYIYRPRQNFTEKLNRDSLPGIILFHTGAGPQDIFLRWKADCLVNDKETFGDGGCVVLIADIIGDLSGWAWENDRTRYESVRSSVIVPDSNGERKHLRQRIQSAIDAIKAQSGVDPARIAALGFCLGGHCILELGRMKNPSVRVMATYHGVFDGINLLAPVTNTKKAVEQNKRRVTIFTGAEDPFITVEDLDAAVNMFDDLGFVCRVKQFQNTRHGFTNPAQDFNPSDAFSYDERAHDEAWSDTRTLLRDGLGEMRS